MSMKDKHEYVDESGYKWRRLYTVPYASIDVNLDPNSKKDFVRRTEKYKTIGETIDVSREMSEKRLSKDGYDSTKQAFFDQYARERKGKRHVAEKARKIETDRVVVDFDAKG